MWSDRKPWWQKKAGDNEGKHAKDLPFAKTWCVIKVHVGHKPFYPNGAAWTAEAIYEYRPVGRANAPQFFDNETGKLKKHIEVDYLTKSEAIAVAKGLNFFEED